MGLCFLFAWCFTVLRYAMYRGSVRSGIRLVICWSVTPSEWRCDMTVKSGICKSRHIVASILPDSKYWRTVNLVTYWFVYVIRLNRGFHVSANSATNSGSSRRSNATLPQVIPITNNFCAVLTIESSLRRFLKSRVRSGSSSGSAWRLLVVWLSPVACSHNFPPLKVF